MYARIGTEAVIEVAREVAHREGVCPTDLPPLYDSIDPDAIEAMVTSMTPGASGSIAFDYCGYEVTVYASGDITVERENRDARLKYGRKEKAND